MPGPWDELLVRVGKLRDGKSSHPRKKDYNFLFPRKSLVRFPEMSVVSEHFVAELVSIVGAGKEILN